MTAGRRRRFARCVVRGGAEWFGGFFNGPVNAAATIVTLLGGSVALVTLVDPLAVVVLAVCFVGVTLASGAYRTWDHQEKLTADAESRFAEMKAERDRLRRGPVPDDHKSTLQDRIQTVCRVVQMHQDVAFPSPAHRAAFSAHFPDLDHKISVWADALRRERDSRVSLRARLVDEVAARDLDQPMYVTTRVVDGLAALLEEKSLDGTLGEGWKLKWSRVGPLGDQDQKMIWLCVGSQSEPMATFPHDPEQSTEQVMERCDQIEAPVSALFVGALTWPETREIADARDDRRSLSEVVVRSAELYGQQSNIPAVEDCDVCRLNLGLPARAGE
jgi:hypothetical protein